MWPAVAIGQQGGANVADGISLWKNPSARVVIEEISPEISSI
jgi:hypothetical protein